MISTSCFCFLGNDLRADVDFVLEFLPFCFLAVAGLFFFLRGMSETILSHDNFLLTEMFLVFTAVQICFHQFLPVFNNSVKKNVEKHRERLHLCRKAACFNTLHISRCESNADEFLAGCIVANVFLRKLIAFAFVSDI